MTLPVKATRLGKLLGFNSSTGNPEASFTIADGTTLTNMSASITAVAGIASNVTSVAGVASNVTTVAGISSNVTTVAGIASDVTAVANVASAVSSAGDNATKAQNYAIKTDGAVESSQYSAKAWAIGGTGVTDTAGSGSAKSWAVEADAVDGSEHSAKSYAISGSAISAGSAKQWALGGGSGFTTSTAVSGGLYSAKYYAELASASFDSFDDKYLGSKSSDPSTDNDGNALATGAIFYHTGSSVLKVWTGSAWNAVAVDTSSFATNGFSVAMAIAL
jgi:hypothetical protein